MKILPAIVAAAEPIGPVSCVGGVTIYWMDQGVTGPIPGDSNRSARPHRTDNAEGTRAPE
jgi:hypothetical protein